LIEKDIAIIGGGPGGYVAAIHAAHLGASVALFEKDKLGGTCLNHGCIPTKALVRSIEVLNDARNAADFGIEIKGVRGDIKQMVSRKNRVVTQLVRGVERLMKSNRISVYHGAAKLVSPKLVRVNDEDVPARNIIIATGSVHSPLPIPGADLPGVLSTDEILELDVVPKSLIVIGGSYTGLEFACIFNSLGTRVTILKRRPMRLEPADEEIGRRFAQLLVRQGVAVISGAAVQAIREVPSGLEVGWETPDGAKTVSGEMVLMATGRVPYFTGLGLSEIGVRTNGAGISVNEYLETNIPDIYAVGDVLGTHMLAHVASYEGEIAVENAMKISRKAEYHAVPSCIFTQPEVASVGITEAMAKDRGIPFKVSKFPFSASGRAVAMGDSVGLVKMICDAADGKILGVHVMGPHASELIAEGTLAVQLGATAVDLAHTIHAHPTLSEAVHETALGQLQGAIHFGKV
jgi:dihydrolipoamide dehydrogenase